MQRLPQFRIAARRRVAAHSRPQAGSVDRPSNSGKTTLFNRLTGLRQKVANFPGVTVEQHVGVAALPDGRAVRIIDLPGVYSLTPRSEDEQIAHDVLTGEHSEAPKPEAVLLVLDSTNLSRHLMLAAPILALGIPTLIILNMADDLRNRGGHVDLEALSVQLGAPVALVSARRGEGIDQVFQFLASTMPKPKRIELPILQDAPKCRRIGPAASGAILRIMRPTRHCGRAVSIRFSCIPSSDLWPSLSF